MELSCLIAGNFKTDCPGVVDRAYEEAQNSEAVGHPWSLNYCSCFGKEAINEGSYLLEDTDSENQI